MEPTFVPAPRVEVRHPTLVQGPDRMIVVSPQKQIFQTNPAPIPAASSMSRPESIADHIEVTREAAIVPTLESTTKQVAHHQHKAAMPVLDYKTGSCHSKFIATLKVEN